MTTPRQINFGSGKDFKPEFLNIDINDYWSPDVVCDLGKPLFAEGDPKFESKRFGRVTLARGGFDRLIAFDVLEHIPDLVTAMTNALELLRTGGVFEVKVPYDLSYGAWQDPTHVRAFNERSWLYYTDWFWYVGWSEARFVLSGLQMEPSPFGQELLRNGIPQEAVFRTPRAIDVMGAVLTKVELGVEDLKMVENLEGRRQALALTHA